MTKTSHIVVDFQNDFVMENGSLSVQAESLGKPIKEIIIACSEKEIENIFTMDWHPSNHSSFASSRGEEPQYIDKSWSDHCVQDTRGAQLHRTIEHDYDKIIRKGKNKNIEEYSGFANGELQKYLDNLGTKELLISGVATDYCVGATALDGKKLGYEVTVISDAIKGVDQEKSIKMIEKMSSAGINFKTTEEILENLKKITI